jgi:Domain of unknown function (DUF4349)
MKTIVKLGVLTTVTVLSFYSCKQASEQEQHAVSEEASTELNSSDSKSIASTNSTSQLPQRKFVRTADIKFKVKNVPQATYAIENTTAKFGGFVTQSNLQSTVSETFNTQINQDSTLETTKYKVENNITIRVPNTKMDTVLHTISKQIGFLDYRVIKADDVSLKMLSNQMTQDRSNQHEKRLENDIDTKGKKLHQIVDAENQLASQKEVNDIKKIENLAYQDQVNYSTLTLQIYQPETLKQEMVISEKSSTDFRPNIGFQILESLKTGWYILETIIAFVLQLWSLFLIGCIAFFLYKRFGKKIVLKSI